MNISLPAIPAPLARALGRLPAYPGSVLFVTGLNLTLARHLPSDTLAMLEGKALRVKLRDAGLAFDFVWRGDRFQAAGRGAPVALTIAASVQDFIAMIQRKEDPDTLFFSRRLIMEGDTELGLLAKNTLDSIDMSVFAWGRPAGGH